MIYSLKPYPAYKESGLPWLGHVPEHWGQRRMKFLFKERSQKGFPSEPLLAATQSKGVVLKEDYGSRTVTAVSGLENLKLVEVGDFVISLRSFQGGIEISHARGIISPAYTVLCPRAGYEPGYFQAFFKSSDFVSSLRLFVTGIREGQSVDYERLSRAFLPLPPPTEQAAIVRFLDWANGRLERAIRAKRKIIALLNEQKQAIIHRAVTRGLDPSVRLRASGIPWLGEIPEHWEVRRAKFLLPEEDVRSTTGDEQLLRVSQYSGVTPKVSDDRFGMRRAETLVGYKVVNSGQLVVNIMIAWNGSLAVTEYDGLVSPAYGVFSVSEPVHPWYVHHLLRTKLYGARIKQESTGVIESRLRLYPDALGRIELLLPPTDEQVAIANHISAETADLDRTASRLEREIALLREYRTRLVADVVTGKLDVREAAERLPEEGPIDKSDDDTELADERALTDDEAEE